jgi:hypothetical protein
MKKFILVLSVFTASFTFAQQKEINVTKDNSWFKAGLTAGLPIGDTADFTSFSVGAELRG